VAFPFGGHPTLKRFIEFAVEQGCKTIVFVRATKEGRSYESIRLENPTGGHVTIPNPAYEEHLEPSMVSHYQRRLGIKTPFAAAPEAQEPKP
jgi:hypothetical protein